MAKHNNNNTEIGTDQLLGAVADVDVSTRIVTIQVLVGEPVAQGGTETRSGKTKSPTQYFARTLATDDDRQAVIAIPELANTYGTPVLAINGWYRQPQSANARTPVTVFAASRSAADTLRALRATK